MCTLIHLNCEQMYWVTSLFILIITSQCCMLLNSDTKTRFLCSTEDYIKITSSTDPMHLRGVPFLCQCRNTIRTPWLCTTQQCVIFLANRAKKKREQINKQVTSSWRNQEGSLGKGQGQERCVAQTLSHLSPSREVGKTAWGTWGHEKAILSSSPPQCRLPLLFARAKILPLPLEQTWPLLPSN